MEYNSLFDVHPTHVTASESNWICVFYINKLHS